MSELPRFTGPAQIRQRMRLAAALGMLASAAIATGGLASLMVGSPVLPRRDGEPTTNGGLPAPNTSSRSAPAMGIDHEVRMAESAVARARAAVNTARQLENVDPALLQGLERRLELLGGSPLDSAPLRYEPTPIARRGRAHIRAVTNTPREL